MASAVGDQAQLRRRKAQAQQVKAEVEAVAQNDSGHDNADELEREYIEYFRKKYGDNPRTDFLGIDGVALFCLIYIVVAGVVLSILYFSVYARHRNIFTSIGSSGK